MDSMSGLGFDVVHILSSFSDENSFNNNVNSDRKSEMIHDDLNDLLSSTIPVNLNDLLSLIQNSEQQMSRCCIKKFS